MTAVTDEHPQQVYVKGRLRDIPDILIPRMGTSTDYATMALIRDFERRGLFCVNRSDSIRYVNDKLLSQELFHSANLPFLKTALLKFPIKIPFLEREFNYPMVLKPICGTQGIHVLLIKDRKSLQAAQKMMVETGKEWIVQEFVQDSLGKDLRVIAIGGQAVACIMRSNEKDFRCNLSCGAKAHLYPIDSQIQELSIKISQLLKLEFAGIDLLFHRDGYRICEVNSSPGFHGMERATGIDIADKLCSYLKSCSK